MTTLLANLGDVPFDMIGIAFTDTASLDALKAFLSDATGRWMPNRLVFGHGFAAKPHDGAATDDARRWTAAQAFRALVEIAGGARVGDRPLERVDGTTAPGGYTDRVLDAIGAVRRLTAAMGKSYPAVRWVVEEYGGIDEFAVVAGVSEEEARENLTAGLDALVDEVDASVRILE